MRLIFLSLIFLALPFSAAAEGGCPPGQYPVGDSRAPGCAPIPGGAGGAAASSPTPTGKWETRWGAIAEDEAPVQAGGNIATGAAVSQKTKRSASSLAIAECKKLGGSNCKIRLVYYNQCAAMADPVGLHVQGAKTIASRAKTLQEAKDLALAECKGTIGQECGIVYAACSMSEFKAF